MSLKELFSASYDGRAGGILADMFIECIVSIAGACRVIFFLAVGFVAFTVVVFLVWLYRGCP